MRIDNASPDQIAGVCAFLRARAAASGTPAVRYLAIGPLSLRLICHSARFMRHVERQMTCAFREESGHYDATLIIWQERNFPECVSGATAAASPAAYREYRLLRLTRPEKARELGQAQFLLYNENITRFWPLVDINPGDASLTAHNPEDNTWYYAVRDLEPEEFIRRGHIFVQILFRFCNTPRTSLAHGAVIGLSGAGALFCAFGYRGKSTLCVSALLTGFEYVSDDYFILGREPDSPLRAWPIYSIVALSPMAYDALYDRFEGKFLSNNGRKDKYMFNIAAYHASFRSAYPVRAALYPNICDAASPGIVPGGRELCLEELCFSTLNNTGNMRDAQTIGKLCRFVDDLPFFRFDLSRNISKNVACLREFLAQAKESEHGSLCAK